MKRRYVQRPDGRFESRDGHVLHITSITLEEADGPEARGTIGGSPFLPEPTEEERQPHRPHDDPIELVWTHYVDVMEPRRRELDPQARAVIRDALKVARGEGDEERVAELCRAIDGCKASPFHMGQNDRGKKYNRLSQILKGKRGGRTTREQIDFFLDIADKSGLGSGVTSGSAARLRDARLAVLDAWQFPGDEQVVRRGEEGAEWLRQHGWVVELAASGRPMFRRADDC